MYRADAHAPALAEGIHPPVPKGIDTSAPSGLEAGLAYICIACYTMSHMKTTAAPIMIREQYLAGPIARYMAVRYAGQPAPNKSDVVRRWIALGMRVEVIQLPKAQQISIGPIPLSEEEANELQKEACALTAPATARRRSGDAPYAPGKARSRGKKAREAHSQPQ